MDTYEQKVKELTDVVRRFDTAMLVTHAHDATLRARPMSVAHVDPNGDLWFATSLESPKAYEMLRDWRVCVVMQNASQFVSLTGRAEIIADRAKNNEYWTESWRPWFPGGPDDPELVLLRVVTTEAEVWNMRGLRGVRYLIDAVKSVARNEQLGDGDTQYHQRVNLR